jgi:hypothetical protein
MTLTFKGQDRSNLIFICNIPLQLNTYTRYMYHIYKIWMIVMGLKQKFCIGQDCIYRQMKERQYFETSIPSLNFW